MQIGSINNTQSFGMACHMGKGLKAAMRRAESNEANRKKLAETRETCASLDSMPQTFYVNISKEDKKKVLVRLIEGKDVIAVRSYKSLKPKRVVSDMCKEISKHAQEAGRAAVVADAIESDKSYFDNLDE